MVTNDPVEDDINSLFKASLAEFTAARNALAARLKKGGRVDAAERVKSLSKPSVSAWAVNQLYWKHREAFDTLMAAGRELQQAHAAQLVGKAVDVRKPTEARREAVSELSRLAAELLRQSDH